MYHARTSSHDIQQHLPEANIQWKQFLCSRTCVSRKINNGTSPLSNTYFHSLAGKLLTPLSRSAPALHAPNLKKGWGSRGDDLWILRKKKRKKKAVRSMATISSPLFWSPSPGHPVVCMPRWAWNFLHCSQREARPFLYWAKTSDLTRGSHLGVEASPLHPL